MCFSTYPAFIPLLSHLCQRLYTVPKTLLWQFKSPLECPTSCNLIILYCVSLSGIEYVYNSKDMWMLGKWTWLDLILFLLFKIKIQWHHFPSPFPPSNFYHVTSERVTVMRPRIQTEQPMRPKSLNIRPATTLFCFFCLSTCRAEVSFSQ